MFKKSRIVIALTLAITLCGVLLAPATLATQEQVFTTATITKVLQVPTGTNVPPGDFKFTFDPISINDDISLKPPVAGIGADGLVTITFPREAPATYTYTETVGDTDIYYLESGELFGNVVWPYAGIYEYNVTENAGTFTTLTDSEDMTYSPAEYNVNVHVREYMQSDIIPSGKSVGDLYIYTIGTYRTVSENGEQGRIKVEPTPGDESTVFNYSQMTFENVYTKHNGGDETDPINFNTLSISKAVAGAYSSSSIYFEFSVTVTKPESVTDSPVYKAYIVDGGAALTNLTANGITVFATDNGGAYVNVSSGTPLSFKLKAGQYLSFTNVHVGASYEVSEEGVAGYVASAIVTTNSIPGGEATGSKDYGLELPDSEVYTLLRVGELTNRTAFTNTNDGVAETGLTISDLPFYSLILLAIGGLAVIVIIKARNGKTKDK